MSDLGFGAGGVAEALQLTQALQTGEIENKQKQVALESSQLNLDNLKKLQASLGGQAFQQAMGSGDPGQQNKALNDLATVYLSDGFPEQAAAITRMATDMTTSRAYSAEQEAQASQKIWTMAGDVLGGAHDAQSWNLGMQLIQSQLTPEQLANPNVQKLVKTPYSPDLVKMMPGFSQHMVQQAQAHADTARALASDAEARHYDKETELAEHNIKETDARTAELKRHGATDLIPSKEEITQSANDLQALFPEAETEPVVQPGGVTDATATRANYKARVESVAQRVAELAKTYERDLKLDPATARQRAMTDLDKAGGLDMLKPLPNADKKPKPNTQTPVTDASGASSADQWGDPTAVNP
jgi:hypothetical protein